MVAGDEVREGKPHPEAYLLAAEPVGVPAADCLAIEDSPSRAASAQAAGCHVLAVPHHVAVPSAPGRTFVEGLRAIDTERLRRLWVGRNVQAR